MRTSIITRIAATAALAAGLAGCGSTDSGGDRKADKDGPIEIGAMFDLTGPFSGVGTSQKQAFELTVKQINAAGGVNGRKLEPQIEDAKTSPDTAVKLTREFIRDGKLAIVGPQPTPSCDAAHRISDAAKALMWCTTPIPDLLEPTLFLVDQPAIPLLGDEPLKFMKDKGWNKIACIHTADASGDGFVKAVKAASKTQGVEVVGFESFQTGDTDVTAQLTRIRSKKPDAIYACASGSNSLPILKGMKQLGMDQPAFTSVGAVSYEVAELAKDSLPKGGVYSQGAPVLIPDQIPADYPGQKKAKAFYDAYRKAYDGRKPNRLTGWVTDLTNILAEGMKKGGSSGEEISKNLEKVCDYQGVLTSYCLSPKDHRGFRPARSIFVRWTPEGSFKLDSISKGDG